MAQLWVRPRVCPYTLAVKATESGADTHNRRSARTGAYFEVRDHVGTST
ncbi:hypothetical protein [Pumilibacter intestinalis]|nr:hypothetical protein [Pumilibacter intestinalis]